MGRDTRAMGEAFGNLGVDGRGPRLDLLIEVHGHLPARHGRSRDWQVVVLAPLAERLTRGNHPVRVERKGRFDGMPVAVTRADADGAGRIEADAAVGASPHRGSV